ncbi:MAG TPA: helix-hairpin-helix domain-containing protein [Mucilaginibacter sp.]|jgi:DNA polymerase (family 10)|nr:helix-hairpin-helix domain-containing protein [Mucilaginibacter sp.]
MENKTIARKLRLLSQLMELHEENPFKVKSIANAAFKVDKLPYAVKNKTVAELEKIDGIGKSTATKITELLATGSMAEMDDLLAKTPQGVVEMMGIKGIGAKKVVIIWKELNIESLGELYYACNENRLVEAKGFGLKTQDDIRNAIEFTMASHGKFLYAQVVAVADQLIGQVKGIFPQALIECAGDFRRCCEIISKLVIVLGDDDENAPNTLAATELLSDAAREGDHLSGKLLNGMAVEIICVNRQRYYQTLFEETGDNEFVKAVLSRIGNQNGLPESEADIFETSGLAIMPPELREGITFINKAETNSLPALVTYDDLRGTLHNHSTWSDGINTIEEMALYCRDELKLQYLGMCDHSKSAFYAKGLTIEQVLQQQEEINHLNKKLDGFQIFKGIESDILYDGSLDYPDEILKRFDFIVASVHSVLKMDEEKATSRLIKAIENPHTTILGHPTGRLLLSRSGYPIDYRKVIDACAANQVVIEINANPLRLDLDWRWHQYALDKGVWLSVNPDAHRKEGFLDMHYGILAARKGGLYKERCLNALSRPAIESFFKSMKSEKLTNIQLN